MTVFANRSTKESARTHTSLGQRLEMSFAGAGFSDGDRRINWKRQVVLTALFPFISAKTLGNYLLMKNSVIIINQG